MMCYYLNVHFQDQRAKDTIMKTSTTLVNEVVVFLHTSEGNERAFVVKTQSYVQLILIIHEKINYFFVQQVLNSCDKS